MTKKKKIILGVTAVVFLICAIGCNMLLQKFLPVFLSGIQKNESLTADSDDEELLALLESENVTIQKTDLQELTAYGEQPEVSLTALETEKEALLDDAAKTSVTDPLTEEAVNLTDIYAESGSEVEFQCYDKDAEAYLWEYFDLSANAWTEIPEDEVIIREDELHRQISSIKQTAGEENHERMFRCRLLYPDQTESSQTGTLYLLKGRISAISMEDVTADANSYLNSMELPVKVTYKDGMEEAITGLYGLYFVHSEENTDYTTSVSGNRVETTTKTVTECNYQKIGLEEKEYLLRYHPTNREDIQETSCTISGKDLYAPVISTVNISPYEVSNIDRAVTLTISIEAEDNETPYPYLEYAFALSGTELTDADWKRKASFDVEITQNGTYIAYVRDESGNVSQMEQKIITVDTKAPVISKVSLTNETGWCKSNTIMVNAEDYGDISYRFISKTDGTDSDWITYSEYAVETNGTWIVQAKDSVGNISETEIVVNNIDKEAPIIRSINIKE